MNIKAEVTPYSSVTGGGVTLVNEKGAVIAQLHLLGYGEPISKITPEAVKAAKADYLAFCERIAAAINAGQAERQVTHTKKGSTYDVIADRALFQVSRSTKRVEIADGDPVTVYRNETGTYVRFPDEMVSPRFEEVTQS